MSPTKHSTWGAQDDRQSIETVHRAVELGVNWIDTAAVYGLGHSEEVVGKALAELSPADRPYVCTKAGLVWDPEDPAAAPRRIMRPDSVRREVEDSPRRLGVEVIDLYQVHWPDTGASLNWDGTEPPEDARATPLEEYWQVMADLKAEGRVRAIGQSNHSPEQLAAAHRIAPVDAVQPPPSLLNRSAEPEIDWAADHGTGVIPSQPLHSAQRHLHPGADRRPRPRRQSAAPTGLHDEPGRGPAYGGPAPDGRSGARYDGGSGGPRLGAGPQGRHGAIAGARRPAQTADWERAARLELTERELAFVAGDAAG